MARRASSGLQSSTVAGASKESSTDGVVIPLNYAQLLGLKGRDLYLEPQITGAYDDLLGAELDAGYSSVARLGREKLLFAAREGMRTARGRLGSSPPDVTVEAVLLPGAMALLEQVGQYELVGRLAREAQRALAGRELRANSRATIRDFRRDTALASALALCGLAGRELAAGRAAAACEGLTEAAAELRDGAAGGAPLAPELQARIGAALEEYQPEAILELLQRPIVEAAPRRHAVAALAALLNRPPPASGEPSAAAGKLTPDYVSRALSCLMSDEICSLLPWEKAAAAAAAGAAPAWWHPRLALQVGTAHLVAGFVQRRPALVTAAARLLHAARADADVAVHIAVCEVLLGQPYEALDTLQQDERQAAAAAAGKRAAPLPPPRRGARSGPPPFPERDGVMAFVRAASPAGDADLLPGLCTFAEQWLARLAMAQVRDTREAPPTVSLAAYFEDPQTEAYLEAKDAPAGPLARAGAALTPLLALPARKLRELRAGGLSALPRSVAYALGAAVLVAAGVFAAGTVQRSARSAASAAPAAVTVAPAASKRAGRVAQPAATTAAALTKAEAECVVKQWLAVKAEAMGPRHNTARLSSVLAQPMLGAVQEEAREAAAAGWFWNIRPLRARVDSLDPGGLTPEGGGYATAVATVDESADLWATNGKKGDSYRSTYRVEYSLVRAGGGWKVASALVLGK